MIEIKELLAISKKLQKKYKKYGLNFTISGNIVGDIGEVLAADKYGLVLCDKNTKDYDAYVIKNGKRYYIQIKASLQGKCYIHKGFIPKHFLALSIDEKKYTLEELYNGPGKYLFDEYVNGLTANSRGYCTLAPGKLIKLNEDVDPNDKI